MVAMNDNSAIDKPDSTTEAQIEEFLQDRPDFFVTREDLLARMIPPTRWKGDGVVDLQKTMLDHLRGEMEDIKNGARDLIETSRSNMSSQARVHEAVLALMAVDGLVAGLRTICDEWPLILDVDVVAIGFEVPLDGHMEPPVRSVRLLEEGFVDDMIGVGRAIALIDEAVDDGTIFGEGAGLVHSAALARIGSDGKSPAGLLALGARNHAFQPGQGTELIGFLARVTEARIGQWLEKPL